MEARDKIMWELYKKAKDRYLNGLAKIIESFVQEKENFKKEIENYLDKNKQRSFRIWLGNNISKLLSEYRLGWVVYQYWSVYHKDKLATIAWYREEHEKQTFYDWIDKWYYKNVENRKVTGLYKLIFTPPDDPEKKEGWVPKSIMLEFDKNHSDIEIPPISIPKFTNIKKFRNLIFEKANSGSEEFEGFFEWLNEEMEKQIELYKIDVRQKFAKALGRHERIQEDNNNFLKMLLFLQVLDVECSCIYYLPAQVVRGSGSGGLVIATKECIKDSLLVLQLQQFSNFMGGSHGLLEAEASVKKEAWEKGVLLGRAKELERVLIGINHQMRNRYWVFRSMLQTNSDQDRFFEENVINWNELVLKLFKSKKDENNRNFSENNKNKNLLETIHSALKLAIGAFKTRGDFVNLRLSIRERMNIEDPFEALLEGISKSCECNISGFSILCPSKVALYVNKELSDFLETCLEETLINALREGFNYYITGDVESSMLRIEIDGNSIENSVLIKIINNSLGEDFLETEEVKPPDETGGKGWGIYLINWLMREKIEGRHSHLQENGIYTAKLRFFSNYFSRGEQGWKNL